MCKKQSSRNFQMSISTVSPASSHASYIGSDLNMFYNVGTTFIITARAPRRAMRF